MGSKEKDTAKKTSIGGQALIEGIMMKGVSKGAMAVRMPDGSIDVEDWDIKPKKWYNKCPVIRGGINFVQQLREGYSCTVICYGTMINAVLAAADTLQAAGYRPEILKLRTISPVDWAAIEASARKTRRVFVLEETSDRECLADEIFAHLIEAGIPAVCRKRNLGRRFVPHGAPAALLAAAGLDADSITTMMQEELSR